MSKKGMETSILKHQKKQRKMWELKKEYEGLIIVGDFNLLNDNEMKTINDSAPDFLNKYFLKK